MTELRPTQSIRRVLTAALAGHTMEWYDFGLYGLLAVQIGHTYFPSSDPTASTLAAFAVFGVAFLARPLGGMILGPIGDRLGRKTALVASLLTMAASTTLIGILPGYVTIGLAAPLLLVLLRFFGGLSAGGETPSAYTYVSEHSPANRRGLYTSILGGGSALGFLLGTAVIFGLQLSMSAEAFDSWGWRIPFLLALPLGLLGLYIRMKIEESPEFAELRASGGVSRSPLREAVTKDWRMMLQAVGISAIIFVSYFVFLSYLPSYLKGVGFSGPVTSLIGLSAVCLTLILFPIMGFVSDRIGRRKLLLIASAYFVVLSWPAFALLSTGQLFPVLLAHLILALGVTAVAGVGPVFVSELARVRTRVSSFALGYNVGGAIFGGSALYVSALLVSMTGDKKSPAVYVIIAGIVTFATLLTVRSLASKKLSNSPRSPGSDEAIASPRERSAAVD